MRSVIASPFGNIELIGEGKLLKSCRRTRAKIIAGATSPILKKTAQQLDAYFKGQLKQFDLLLDPDGTDFQKKVWEAVATIPYGSKWSYKQLAAAIGSSRAARAVGTANAHCEMWIIIPCHRVISADGSLGGYGGDLRTKQRLLDLESSNTLPSFLP
jgi:methylated-DNA-[protein]-cysteine S-methyltransferase